MSSTNVYKNTTNNKKLLLSNKFVARRHEKYDRPLDMKVYNGNGTWCDDSVDAQEIGNHVNIEMDLHNIYIGGNECRRNNVQYRVMSHDYHEKIDKFYWANPELAGLLPVETHNISIYNSYETNC